MKKFIGLVILCFVLFGCATIPEVVTTSGIPEMVYVPEPDKITKFEGIWANEVALSRGYQDFSFTFTGDKVYFQSVDRNGEIELGKPGTFTYTNTTITFIPEEVDTWQGYTQKYTLINNVLILESVASDPYVPIGRFIKQ
jgi:hypothetical protein